MTTIAWFDGGLVDPRGRHLSVLDHGFVVGDGVFETCELLEGVPFALTRHLDRLRTSALGLGIAAPDDAEVRAAVGVVADAWNDAEPGVVARLRITWTGGLGPLGSDRGDGPGTLVVAASAAPQHGDARVHVVPWARNERGALAGLKTTSYGENARALARARAHGAGEAIFGNTRGELCEGTGTNVFLEDAAGLLTPPLDSGALAGVTRALVLRWAAEAGIPVREETVPLAAIHEADHVALTSSTRGIAPVVAVDGVAKEPGPLTLAMGRLFPVKQRENLDP
ncbi:aminotransferase class IV [Litorihabitans aurantiacus]|uniref:4-amino-4-deoxychorismate lyase n=1 Tax=Litorihabitans aurantiacus TaxID=1930061 RepID=A0AA38CQU0_9MICO|nr:aminotransferase class IV [Litorihabitans aurantiacus]GMA31391.1 4-amino-4-deoxychorismate lyase [Litorihabitans aurantiacus]